MHVARMHSIVNKDLAARLVNCSNHVKQPWHGRPRNTQTEQLVLANMSSDEKGRTVNEQAANEAEGR